MGTETRSERGEATEAASGRPLLSQGAAFATSSSSERKTRGTYFLRGLSPAAPGEAPASPSVNVPAESPKSLESRGKGIKWRLSRCRGLLTLFVLNDHESKGGERKTHQWKLN